ncbi:hypothetical protein CRV01_05665 [Arcobacter sp. CECT 8983]|uniref:hypothetical protein n=1 Tax=Arcobacter sp. CECT 8983 TaxID=2044508 RepID=UPI00100BD3C8|nr:hypothetical protein [Arcobacter sp. CECT 8983]RXJ90636.1 hypothetical protein CRV01_05665 [Arcobacter sp. CECT 8983]
MLFKVSDDFINIVESYLLFGRKRHLRETWRILLYPLIMILKGVKLFYKELSLLNITTTIIMVSFINSYFLEFIETSSNSTKEEIYFIIISFFIGYFTFNSIFSTPGSLYNFGINSTDINSVMKELIKINPSTKFLNKLRDNIKLSYQRYISRFIFLRTIFALLWAFNTYLFTYKKGELDNIFVQDFNFKFYILIIILFCLLELYKKSGDFVYKCIFYSLNEYEIRIDKEIYYNKKYERPYDLPV